MSLLIVAHAFITNKMDYCNSQLFGLPNTLLYKLQHLQNSTSKLITGKHQYDHKTPELIKLWLPVKERISFRILLITFKCLNNLVPKYLSDLILIHKSTWHLQSANSVLLDMPGIEQVTYGGSTFSYAAPFLWNKLPQEIRTCQHFEKFKRLLKTHLFRTAFNSF